VPEALIIDAVRTPMGAYRGALSGIRPDDLAAHVVSAAVERTGLDPSRIDDLYLGAANQAGRTTATSPAWPPCSPGCRSMSRE
jgi:acetyl-CoA acetyltransferase